MGMGAYTYLCGGSSAACSPDPTSEDCTPGGNAGLGGGAGLGGSAASDAGTLACQLVGANNQVAAVCGMAGTAAANMVCKQTSDCQAGLGCVEVGNVSLCLTYCCQSLEACPNGTYCARVPLAEAPKNDIPVCIPTTPCMLLQDSTCPSGQTCAIVRASGSTTSCVTPGSGMTGQACPCAPGFTCSWTENTCLQLCTTTPDSCPLDNYCQGGTAPYPDGVGYCVSLD
jgi:hypothetical protein